jgi:NAD(P)-dependent dehydrogenase (short-subunit alcohol dehydrogenase family)
MDRPFNPFSLGGRRVLVTGASSGIGRQIAIHCSRMGAQVVACGRDQARLDSLMHELSGEGNIALRGDLTADEGIATMVAQAGTLNGVVHCAGISRLAPIKMVNAKHLREVSAINFDAPVLLTQRLLAKGSIAGSGSIVFISSIAAHIGVPGVGIYSASKAALIAMMRCLAMEVVKRGIRVNCLSPALVESPLLDATEKLVGSLDAERANYPLGFGKPEDVANAAVFLLSEASRWITGTTIVMDGGLTIG